MREPAASVPPARRRGDKQERSQQRRAGMVDAIVTLMAHHGIAGLTHRLVAQEAGVSLAATTYYFDSKFDMVAAASHQVLDGYTEAFRRAALSGRNGSVREYVVRLLVNAVGRDRTGAACWAEIMLDAPRHAESLALAREWFAGLVVIWQDIARSTHAPDPQATAGSAIDAMIGLLLAVLALGLTEEQVAAVMLKGAQPLDAWAPPALANDLPPLKPGRKSAETRDKIIAAAIAILTTDGSAAVTYRNVAQQAGLAPAGPAYHFPTVDSLLAAAQAHLFEDSKQRYRVAAAMDSGPRDLERLIDRTSVVFLREVTAFADQNLANFTVWLEAARRPELRPMVWNSIADQTRAWKHVLADMGVVVRPLDALLPQCMFIGKMIRLLATGSPMQALETARREFASDLTALAQGRFWLSS
ncbi:TetR/AcrR family transcriptional regulator [Niveispirillum sp. KHB5.9]|uniref:TetR/AcrR family transcriptional regulator n=1 Tax=Niveispirillum sp. KHB5.9 TaxID=3400269 RepID=UPI003A8B7948